MGLLIKLIEQAKNPRGFIGRTMLKIMNSAHSQMMYWGLSKADLRDDLAVLDVGCGGGKTVSLLCKLVNDGKIYGVDYSKEAVEASIKENQEAVQSGRVLIKQGSVSSLPFERNFFDVITAFQTHYFWPDLKGDIKEINSVLKDNGQFVLAAERYKINYHMKDFTTAESMKKLLLESGFKKVNIFVTKENICFVGIK